MHFSAQKRPLVLRKRLCSIALLAAVSLGIMSAGCNNSTGVTFGVILPESGELAGFGPSWINGINLAVAHINEGGGILGRSLAVVTRDSGTRADTALSAAQELIETHGVGALIGAGSSAVTMALVDTVQEAGVVLISPAATSPAISTLHDAGLVWRTAPPDTMQGSYMAARAVGLGLHDASVFYQEDDYGRGIRDGFSSAYQGEGGTLYQTISCGTGQSSYLAELEELFADPIDVAVLATYINNARVILNQWHGLDRAGTWMLSEANFHDLLLASGETAAGTYVVEIGSREETGFSGIFEAAYGSVPQTFTANAYDALMLLALAAHKAGSLDGGRIASCLTAVSGPGGELVGIGADQYGRALSVLGSGGEINYEGASGSIDFDGSGDVTDAYYRLWRVDQGQFVRIE